MRTELKVKRLIKRHTSYTRHDPILPGRVGEPVVMETVYCFKESDLKKFMSGLIDIHNQAIDQGLDPQGIYYAQYIGKK
jgi:hypothetical protein